LGYDALSACCVLAAKEKQVRSVENGNADERGA
jgi:hypothetical protein